MEHGEERQKIVIATIKSWNIENAKKLKQQYKDEYEIHIITKKEELNHKVLKKLKPKYIFFPHWSWIIPKEIYNNFECVVFHITDLPYGRGGSPLQNLIVRGVTSTKISAIKVDGGIDTGDVYMKKDFELHGTAEEIFIRASHVVFKKMIPTIMNEKIMPYKQQGNIVHFKRRKPYQSEIPKESSLKQVYDYIRMLDGEGYPEAFIRYGGLILKFSRASLKEGKIVSDVEIMEVNEHNE